MSSNAASKVTATLADVQWMCGAWTGELGPQRVEECWSEPKGGTMSTMIRLTTDTDTVMIELISIRETDDSLVLHLRQFSPALEPLLSQDMPLVSIAAGSAAFDGPEGGQIQKLGYRSIDASTLEVDVTIMDGTVLTAALKRL